MLPQQGHLTLTNVAALTAVGHHNFIWAQGGLASLLTMNLGLEMSQFLTQQRQDRPIIQWYSQGGFGGDCLDQWQVAVMLLPLSCMASSLWDPVMALAFGGSMGLFCLHAVQLLWEEGVCYCPSIFSIQHFSQNTCKTYMYFRFSFGFLHFSGQRFLVKVNSVAWEQPRGLLGISGFKTMLGNRGCSPQNTFWV